uniref:Uncharacterized protein n=1 Tax=Arundo donax TaxID=35708 RepID=A0A0A8YZL2_ARUDO
MHNKYRSKFDLIDALKLQCVLIIMAKPVAGTKFITVVNV